MNTYMAKLGSFMFGLDTAAFQTLKRVSTYRWQAQDRIGKKPALQNTGQGADTITLSGEIYPHFRGGLGQIGALRAQAANGKPLTLIYAFENVGQYCGLWCVTEISETRTVLFSNGTPRKIEFDMTLLEYGDDAGIAAATNSAAQLAEIRNVPGFELAGSNALLVTSTAGLSASASAILPGDMSGALSMGTSVGNVATDFVGQVKSTYDGLIATDAGKLLKSTINQVKAITALYSNMNRAIEMVKAADGNVLAMTSAMENMQTVALNTSGALSKAASSIAGASAVYNGGSINTVFAQQATNISKSVNDLSTSAGSISKAASYVKDILNG